jgi:hypothetical protein
VVLGIQPKVKAAIKEDPHIKPEEISITTGVCCCINCNIGAQETLKIKAK